MIEQNTKISFNIDEIATAMAFHSDLNEWYLNIKTGEICLQSLDDFSDNEEDTDELGEDWVLIPSIPSYESYRWMEEFVNSLPDGILPEKLAIALNGKGAFRRFKDVLIDSPAEREAWFKFENEKIQQEAKNWLAATAPQLI